MCLPPPTAVFDANAHSHSDSSIGVLKGAGLMIFGRGLPEFHNFESCISTLMRLLFGDFEYEKLRRVSDFTAMYVFSFLVVEVIIMLNMIIAILTQAYDEVNL